MMAMRTLLAVIGGSFVLLLVVLLVRTFTVGGSAPSRPECTPLDADFIRADPGVIHRLQGALQLRTVSYSRQEQEHGELKRLQEHIKASYPAVHSSPLVTLEIVANYSMLYSVRGSDPALKPYLLCAHLDVVPADPDQWDVPPFEGRIKDQFIYGRGTIDFKHGIMGIMEALEFLLTRGHEPRRPFFVAFGHDEEVTGMKGAAEIGKLLKSRGIEIEFLLDEGLTVLDGFIPGMSDPVAMVGTSEKGYLTMRMSVNTTGGHSSMPVSESSISILARAVTRLQENPHTNMFGQGPTVAMFEQLAPHMSFPLRVVMSNLWLFGPLVSRILSRKATMNAFIRTTTAVTQFHGGVKENVLPQSAWATVNHRVHPAQTIAQVLEADRALIDDDRVKFEVVSYMDPQVMSPHGQHDFGFQTVSTSIHQVWAHHGVIVVPGLLIGNTDTRHYEALTSNIYRFSPTYMYPGDERRFHGNNERISVENYQDAVNFYYHVMSNADSATLPTPHAHSNEL